jgi:Bardet-Biedl syndrome 5 protein
MDKRLNYEEYYVWQDREVKFDIPKQQLSLHPGEKAFETIDNIEDYKGNNGDIGTIIFTNLRIIWYSTENIKINLSVGLDTLISHDVKFISSKVAGETRALCIKCKFNGNRFEFLFNSLGNSTTDLFSLFDSIYKGYETSRLYRDVKMKGFLTQDKNLTLLPKEKVINKFNTVYNITTDNQALAGQFQITSVRFVWFSTTLDNYNISLPWIHIKDIRIREINKHGKVIQFETNKLIANNIFSFKFTDNIDTVLRELESTYYTYLQNPQFGVDLTHSDHPENLISREKPKPKPSEDAIQKQTDEVNKYIQNRKDDDVEIVDTNYFNDQSNLLYYMTSKNDKKNTKNDIVYSVELGMAIERLPDNTNLESLWKIIIG